MKKILKVIMFSMFLFVIYGCTFTNEFNVKIPEYTEFSEQEDAFFYKINSVNDLKTIINACTTRFELTNHDGEQIKVDVYYDEQDDRDQLNFSFNDDELTITNSNQKSEKCSFTKKIDSYVRISLPREMNHVSVDINAYSSFANFNDLQYEKLTYKQINGSIDVSGDVSSLTLDTVNGTIQAEHINSENIDFETTNGNITINKAEINSKLNCKLSNGNILITDSIIAELEAEAVNGDIGIRKIKNLTLAGIATVNGSVELEHVNSEQIETINSSSIASKTTNGDVELTNVYATSVDLKTINGDIVYQNDNKDFYVEHVTYQKVNGDTTFEINGSIKKK